MKILLTVFCVLIILFAGGCGLIVSSAGGGTPSLILFGAALINLIIVITLWSASGPWRPAFWILGAIDLLLAVGLLVAFGKDARDLAPFLFLLCAAFGLKGILTLYYARNGGNSS
jgi:hypothetical protein